MLPPHLKEADLLVHYLENLLFPDPKVPFPTILTKAELNPNTEEETHKYKNTIPAKIK